MFTTVFQRPQWRLQIDCFVQKTVRKSQRFVLTFDILTLNITESIIKNCWHLIFFPSTYWLIVASDVNVSARIHSSVNATWSQSQGEESWFVLTPVILPYCLNIQKNDILLGLWEFCLQVFETRQSSTRWLKQENASKQNFSTYKTDHRLDYRLCENWAHVPPSPWGSDHIQPMKAFLAMSQTQCIIVGTHDCDLHVKR